MAFQHDTDLTDLFIAEVAERSAKLIDAAEKMAAGRFEAFDPNVLYREGHTIKGTGRMMGFSVIGDAGKLLEDVWRRIDAGELKPTEMMGEALARLSRALEPAVTAPPDKGTPELRSAMTQAVEVVIQAERAAAAPPPEPEPTTPAEVLVAESAQGLPDAEDVGVPGDDLGGLLGVLDSWAFGETVRVNAASLFRLINDICSLRVDSGALAERLGEVTKAMDDPASLARRIHDLGKSLAAAESAVDSLQSHALRLAAAPLSEVTNTFPQLVRYIARKSDKEVRFELVGDQLDIDRQVLEGLADALRQVIVNAVEHGVEPIAERTAAGKTPTATVALRAAVVDNRLEIVIEDDGRGIDWEAVHRTAVRKGLLPDGADASPDALRALLFSPEFSTATKSELVGDGNGLATVAEAIEELHGSVTIETTPGHGTTVSITVPTSRALQDALLIRSARQTWGIPALSVLERVPLAEAEVTGMGHRRLLTWRGRSIDLLSFAKAVGLVDQDPQDTAVVVQSPSGPVAFEVANVLGRRQVAARELGPLLGGVRHLTGAALLGGGDVVVLVDPGRLSDRARALPVEPGSQPRVLIVDDSKGARQVVAGALGSDGFVVDAAESADEALRLVEANDYDAIVIDFILPAMDGATLTEKLRGDDFDKPIVILSGLATQADKERVLQSGADRYFDKSDMRQGALSSALTELIEGRRS